MKKLNTLLIMSAFTAGIIFCCGFGLHLPKGVIINGVEVGGLPPADAVLAVRSRIEEDLKTKQLKIIGKTRTYVFSFPEISYKDDLQKLVKSVKSKGNYTAEVRYYLCGAEEIAMGICRNERIYRVEPYAEFHTSGKAFTYFQGNDGREVDLPRLKSDIYDSLKGGFEPVTIKFFTSRRTKSMESVQADTSLLGRYTTYFDSTNVNRANNIRLAAALINGVTLESGKTFSFNSAVGARLPERGFLSAKIIENGEYVEGVGGGVCQASTTLYNAALISGMTVTEHHAHSLAVGYVPPSRDAMVSGSSCDLKFTNPTPCTVYIRARTTGGSVTFELYGRSDGAKYSLESEITEIIPAPINVEDPAAVPETKDGIKSRLYLLTTRNGYTKRELIRQDAYNISFRG